MTRAEQHLILSYSVAGRKAAGWAAWVDRHFGSNVQFKEADPPQLSADSSAAHLTEAVAVLPRPILRDQYDTAVNVTSLALFAKCPRKYYIQRYLGWTTGRPGHFDPEIPPPDDDSEISAAELGSYVHDLLAGKPGDYPAEAHAMANVFLESNLGRRAAAASRSAREWDFIAEIDGTVVRGSIDLWFEENGEIVLVDYKTDSLPIHPDDYAPQLAIYALALERALGVKPARAYLHFLRPNRVVEVSLGTHRDLIGELREAQNEMQFDLREGDHCKQCAYYRSPCPAGLSLNQAVMQ